MEATNESSRWPLQETIVCMSNFGNSFWENLWSGEDRRSRRVCVQFYLLMVFVAWCDTMIQSSIAVKAPFVFPLTDEEFDHVHGRHVLCWESLCDEAKDASFSCSVDRRGNVKLDHSSIFGEGIRFTDECSVLVEEAFEVLFGPAPAGSDPTVSNQTAYELPWLLRFASADDDDKDAFNVVTETCVLDTVVFVTPVLLDGNQSGSTAATSVPQKIQSSPLMLDAQSGQQTFEPRNLFCYDHMKDEMQAAVPEILHWYTWCLRNHRPLLAFVGYPLMWLIICTIGFASILIVKSLMRALVLQCIKSWIPKPASLGGHKVTATVGSMFQALAFLEYVLVVARTTPTHIILCLFVLAPVAWISYRDVDAGLNWIFMFLAMTPLGTASFVNTKGSVYTTLVAFDSLYVIRGCVSFLLWLSPGEGWNKVFGLLALHRAVFRKPTESNTTGTRNNSMSSARGEREDGVGRSKMD